MFLQLGWTLEHVALYFYSIFSSTYVIATPADDQRMEGIHTSNWCDAVASFTGFGR